MIKTYQPKAKEIKRGWHLINADGEILGRLGTKAAIYLMGKHKPTYSAHLDSGDFVVIVNAEKIELTGKKKEQKIYRRHSGYPGGLKEIKFAKLIKERPTRVLELAIAGMLPDNKLKADRMSRLKVFAGEKHPYASNLKSENPEKDTKVQN